MTAPFDVVSFGETMLRFTALPGRRLEETREYTAYVGGTESNVLSCLALLGLRCAWLSALPANPLGRRVASELRRYGVDVSGVVWKEGGRLGLFFAEELAEPPGVQIMYDRVGSACAQIDPDMVDSSFIERTRLLHLSGITPALGGGARTVFDRLLQAAQGAGVPISFDVNYRGKLWEPGVAAEGLEEACRAATLLFCTEQDAADLWDLRGAPQHVLRALERRFGTAGGRIVLTRGGGGSMQIADGTITDAAAFPSTGPHRIGSGDAFAAGYLYGYLEGPLWDRMHADGSTPLHLGNAVAALKRSIAGDVALVTPNEVMALVTRERERFR